MEPLGFGSLWSYGVAVPESRQLILIGIGGVIGASIRWGITSIPDQAVLAEAISIPTLVANVMGCMVLGLLVANPVPDRLQWPMAVGVSGGLTTMSTLAVEIVDGFGTNVLTTLAYIGLSVGLGALGFWLGSMANMSHPETPRAKVQQALGFALASVIGLLVLNGVIGAVDAVFDEGFFVAWAFAPAAFAGTVLRALITKLDAPPERQMQGVLAANVLGSFLLGFLTGRIGVDLITGLGEAGDATEAISSMDRASLIVWGTAALGAFTTFSTMIFQFTTIAREQRRARAVQVVSATLILTVGAAALGRLLGGI